MNNVDQICLQRACGSVGETEVQSPLGAHENDT